MPLNLLLLSLVLLNGGRPVGASPSGCVQVLHSKNSAIQLRCCTFDEQPEDATCSLTHKCHCLLEVWAEDLDCAPASNTSLHYSNTSSTGPQTDQSTGSTCQHLQSIPREGVVAELSLKIRHWKQSQCLELLNTISKYNVTSLSIDFNPLSQSHYSQKPDESSKTGMEFPNLGLFVPRLKYLNIVNQGNEYVAHISSTSFLRDLSYLEILKVTNVDFEVGTQQEEALWIHSVQLIHIENSSLSQLPWWMSKCHRLHRLIIRNSQLNSALVVSQIASLVYLDLRGNQLEDLSPISFSCERVQEIDLSENFLVKIAPHTFRQCILLRSLDLSHNFLDALPPKSFVGNGRLKHLKLRNNRIRLLRPDHFAGLQGLRSLVLSGNPLQDEEKKQGVTSSGIEPFAFLPVKWIRKKSIKRTAIRFVPLPTTNEAAIALLLDTLIQLPVWLDEPCTPFMWHLHLSNSSYEMRQRGWLESTAARPFCWSARPSISGSIRQSPADEEEEQGVTSSGIEPFAFLPVKWIRSLELDDCSLTCIPWLSPSAVVPLPTTNEAAIALLLDTLIQLPVWLDEPCTPFMWHLHLSNSSYEMRQRVAGWNVSRMHREKLDIADNCMRRYSRGRLCTGGPAPGLDLAENSGCEASRKLRSAKHLNSPSNGTPKSSRLEKTFACACPNNLSTTNPSPCGQDSELDVATSTPYVRSPSTTYLMLTSLVTNFAMFLVLIMHLVRIATKKILLSSSFPQNTTTEDQEEAADTARTPLKKTTGQDNRITIYTNQDILNT
uniref:Uncharacterized protein n=1 Tax=Ditylenchus dipsaci TaxID=166011 RepID=A0A915DBQ8_9BILA